MLSCEHAVCDICVHIFGQVLPDLKYHYHISKCILCLSETLTVKMKSLTAEYQILSVNEENTQGIVPLEFMNMIQNLICECSVQDLFDKAWGMSSDKCILDVSQLCSQLTCC